MALQIFGGLFILLASAEILVRGAVVIARHLGIPNLIIGLTIVALGTSAPEMVVTVQAALTGHPDIAVGNIMGSNIANILLVLAVTAMIFPVHIIPAILKRDLPLLLVITGLFMLFCSNDAVISLTEAIILLFCLAGFLWLTIISTRNHRKQQEEEQEFIEEAEGEVPQGNASNLRAALFLLIGIGGLAFGADILVTGAVALAHTYGIAEGVVGATIVAIGSSAPELATCAVAAFRKHADIVAGNIIGSNILNILVGISVPALITPLPVAVRFIAFDMGVMAAAALILAAASYSCKTIYRPMGVLFLLGYIAYLAVQFV